MITFGAVGTVRRQMDAHRNLYCSNKALWTPLATDSLVRLRAAWTAQPERGG